MSKQSRSIVLWHQLLSKCKNIQRDESGQSPLIIGYSLTVGSTVGSIRDLFAKVKAIDAKHGKFDLLICIGDFFGPERDEVVSEENDDISQLLDGRLQGVLISCRCIMYSILISCQAPIECYVMQGEYPLPTAVIEKFATTGGELCKNVFLMSTFMKTISTNSRSDII